MFHRAFVVGVALTFAAPLAAWQATPPAASVPAAAADAVVKRQIQTFEMALRSAVELGGQRFTQRMAQVMPGMYWFQADQAVIDSFVLPDQKTLLFQVRVPGLRATSVEYYDQMNRGRPSTSSRPSSAGGAQPVSNSARATASGGEVTPDPMTESSVISDPNPVYVADLKAAIVDAILDSSAVLPLGSDDVLVVAASAVDVANANPLYNPAPAKMYFQIKGSDYAAFRDHQITRDQAKERIVERRF